MIRYDDKVVFTHEDIANLTIMSYSQDEIDKNMKQYLRKAIIMELIFLMLFICCIFLTKISWILCGTSLFIVLVFAVTYDVVSFMNYKFIKSENYVELIVNSKNKPEHFDYGKDITYYSIEGTDVLSKYATRCYISRKEYKDAVVGERIRISIIKEDD